jgi:single-stranded-DNA-specific exonuclease
VVPWKVREADPKTVASLSSELGVRAVTARCLAGRGIFEAGAARSFLRPRLAQLRPPAGLAGFDPAVARLADAVAGGERIGCFGDYDVDGVTTAAVFTSYLREVGAEVVARVARRDAGYGFGVADAEAFAAAGCSLLVTGDCGTSDVAAIRRARELGMEVVVVDHHTVPELDPSDPHPALSLVNPLRADSTFPFRGMASVGLMFYMMVALRTRLRDSGFFRSRSEPDVRDLLDLVALGTVADLVPLQGENRILTHHGMVSLGARLRPGIDALMRMAGVDGDRPVDEKTISWKLAPRINAPGRLGDAAPSLNLLLAADPGEAARWAEELERANDARRVEQDRVMAEASEMLEESEPGAAVVVAGRGWAAGVVGIVASKLVDRYQRPCFVIAVDEETGEGRGSGRSCGGVDLYRALASCERFLVRFGGHAGAAGLTVDETRVGELAEALASAVERQEIAETGGAVTADAEVELGEVDGKLADELGQLAPFGRGNEQPLLVSRGLRVRESRCVGADGTHLKMQLEDQTGAWRSAIGFGLAASDPGPGATVDAAFAPVVSTWQGQRRVELQLRELAPAS